MKYQDYLMFIVGCIIGDISNYVLYGDSIILKIIYNTMNLIYVVM